MISVIICAHNPRDNYIARVLAALQAQTLARDAWELTVVDNASTERLDQKLDLSWHPLSSIVRENEIGLTPARLRGIRESIGELIVFVDDDNVIAPDYLQRARDVHYDRGFLGAWSGSVVGEFEETPAEWTRRYWGNLVIRDVQRDVWSNIYLLDETTPLGAGLCVRREVALEYLRIHERGLRPRMLDRSGGDLVSGGDNDLASCAIDIGLSCGLISSLHVAHLIPRERLTEDYLLRLIESVSYSATILRSFRPATVQLRHDEGLAKQLADVLRRMRMTPRERRFHSAVASGSARARKELESA